MSDTLERIAISREQAHEAATLAYQHAQALLLNGERVRITCGTDDEPLSVKQRKFLHGPVLHQIAEQVRVNGERYVMKTWKEFFRVLLLECRPKYEMVRIPKWDATKCALVQPKRATPRRVRQSTEDLSVKQYSDYIDRVIAHAATEFGVRFVFDIDEREAVRYRPPARARRVEQPEPA